MNTAIQHKPSTLLSRRRVLKLAVASVLLISGCAGMTSSSDLDAATNDLGIALKQVGDNDDQEQLTSISRRIQSRARELGAEHREFVNSFDHLLSDYDATEAQLKQLIDAYAKRRKLLRDDLLHLQDELHAALTPEQWAEVVQVLNQTGNALSAYTLSEI
jgi:Spy/CpxP family protein refolding chaperone